MGTKKPMHSEGLLSRVLLLAVLCLSSLQLRAAETLIYAARLIDRSEEHT